MYLSSLGFFGNGYNSVLDPSWSISRQRKSVGVRTGRPKSRSCWRSVASKRRRKATCCDYSTIAGGTIGYPCQLKNHPSHWIPWKLTATRSIGCRVLCQPLQALAAQVWNITRPMQVERRLPSGRSWRTKLQHWSQSTSPSAFIWRPPMSPPLVWNAARLNKLPGRNMLLSDCSGNRDVWPIFICNSDLSNLFNLFKSIQSIQSIQSILYQSISIYINLYFRWVILSHLYLKLQYPWGRWLRRQGPWPTGSGTQICKMIKSLGSPGMNLGSPFEKWLIQWLIQWYNGWYLLWYDIPIFLAYLLWISMDIYGYLWISMDIYGYLWISTQWIPMKHGQISARLIPFWPGRLDSKLFSQLGLAAWKEHQITADKNDISWYKWHLMMIYNIQIYSIIWYYIILYYIIFYYIILY